MLSPFPIMTGPLIGVSLYTLFLLLVMWLVAAESPIKMSFPILGSVISLVTRALSFSSFSHGFSWSSLAFLIFLGWNALLPRLRY